MNLLSTTIRLSKETVKRLKAMGRKNETYEGMIKRLLEVYERQSARTEQGTKDETEYV